MRLPEGGRLVFQIDPDPDSRPLVTLNDVRLHESEIFRRNLEALSIANSDLVSQSAQYLH